MPKQITGRNPYVAVVRDPKGPFREKAAKSGAEREAQRDRFSRNAKHKGKIIDEEIAEAFQHGDTVELEVKGKDGKPVTKTGMVKNPKAPMGLVGLTLDGEYALIPEEDLKLVIESLARMIELSK